MTHKNRIPCLGPCGISRVLTVLFFTMIICLAVSGCERQYYYRMGQKTFKPSYAVVPTGRAGYEEPNVLITKLDFVPIEGGSYHLRWTKEAIEYDDCYKFRPIIEIQDPAPKDFMREFDIVADPSPDEMIGVMKVYFKQGGRVPDKVEYQDVVPGSGARAPIDTPPVVYNKFWMGCTKKGKIKANAVKNGEDAKVYIDRATITVPADGVVMRRAPGVKPVKHRVWCK